MKRIIVVVAAGIAALLLAGLARADSAVQQGHQFVPPTAGSLGKATPLTTSSSQLPFTGLDLAGIVIVGALLVGAGTILFRSARRPS
ncbi:MAG TPA: hypothetical protein VNH40_08395 [Gaiellaceae bacterium]|nr:hypothetical protein [Gaiellaceae bacterium]